MKTLIKTVTLTPRHLSTLSYPVLTELNSLANIFIKTANQLLTEGSLTAQERIKIEMLKISYEIEKQYIKEEIDTRAEMIPFHCIEKMLA